MSYKQALDAGLTNNAVIDTTTVNATTVNASTVNTQILTSPPADGLSIQSNFLIMNIAGDPGRSGYVLTSNGSLTTWQPTMTAQNYADEYQSTGSVASYILPTNWNSGLAIISVTNVSSTTTVSPNLVSQLAVTVNYSDGTTTQTQARYTPIAYNTAGNTGVGNITVYFKGYPALPTAFVPVSIMMYLVPVDLQMINYFYYNVDVIRLS